MRSVVLGTDTSVETLNNSVNLLRGMTISQDAIQYTLSHAHIGMHTMHTISPPQTRLSPRSTTTGQQNTHQMTTTSNTTPQQQTSQLHPASQEEEFAPLSLALALLALHTLHRNCAKVFNNKSSLHGAVPVHGGDVLVVKVCRLLELVQVCVAVSDGAVGISITWKKGREMGRGRRGSGKGQAETQT